MKEIIPIGLGPAGLSHLSSYLLQIISEHSSSPSSPVAFFPFSPLSPRFLAIDTNSFSSFSSFLHPSISSSLLIQPSSLLQLPLSNILPSNSSITSSLLSSLLPLAEECESLQGFLFFVGMDGMEGSLLGSRVVKEIKDLFPNKLIFTIMSGEFGEEEGGGGSLVGYNQTLGIGGGVGEESDWILMVDGREGEGVNSKIGKYTSDITSGSRFKGYSANSLRKICTTSVVFPRMKFFSANSFNENEIGFSLLPPSLFLRRSLQRLAKNENGSLKGQLENDERLFNFISIARGDYASSELEEMNQEKIVKTVFDWSLDYNFIGHSYNKKNESMGNEITFFNRSKIQTEAIRCSVNKFDRLFKRKAFLWHYCDKLGIDEMEFVEAESNMNDLICELTPYSCGINWEDNDMDYEMEDF